MAKLTYKERIISKLVRTNIPIAQIARDTGIGERWLHRIKKGETLNPRVNQLDVLAAYFGL